MGVLIRVNQSEFEALIAALDRSLALFAEKPADPGFDRAVYDELRRARETLIRAQRDLRDPNTQPRRDSKSPLEM